MSTRRTVLGRVLFSYAVVTLSFVLVVAYSVLGQRRSARETELMRSGYIPLIVALRDAVAGQNTFNSQLNHITEAQNPADKRVWFETNLSLGRPKVFAELRAALARAFAEQNTALRVDLATEAHRIERFLEGDKEILARLFEALKHGDELAAEALRAELVSRGTQALQQLRVLESRVNLHLDEVMGEIAKRERWTFRVLAGWALFSVALGGVMALYTRRVLRPVAQITARANVVASGDLTPRPAISTPDEIGDLARTFESMVEAIARANRELVESERLATIGKMAAHVTHEVRNPLSSIALNLELLQDELPEDSEARALHSAIAREVARLGQLTEQYLSLTRRDRPHLQPDDLGDVVNEAMVFLREDLRRARVESTIEIADSLPTVWIDEAQIRQVVVNLVRNARQAMPDGGRLRVVVDREGDAVVLSIEDTGTGIDEQTRKRLFEPFSTTKSHGTGLGLAICKQIVEAHRGTIEYEHNEPRGTRFLVRLPTTAPDVRGTHATTWPPAAADSG